MPDENLKGYVLLGIRTRYNSIESDRAAQEDEESPEPCYFAHCGTWDVSFNDISNKVSEGVLAVAQNEQQADKLLTAIFEKVRVVPGTTGGDHHTGYFGEYDVKAQGALTFATDIKGLPKILTEK